MNKGRLLFCFVLFGTGSLLADDAPKPPYIQPPPAGSQWTITVKSSSPADPSTVRPALEPTKVQMRIDGNRTEEITVNYAGGATNRFYILNDFTLQKADNSDKIAILPLAGERGTSLRARPFPATAWIHGAAFVGRETLEGVDCFKFRANPAKDAQVSASLLPEAWVRVSDSTPVRVTIGPATYDFSPTTPYSGTIQLPPEYEAALARHRTSQKLLEKLKKPSSP